MHRRLSLRISPNHWSCIPTSFAMVFGIPVQKIFDKLGHDGSEILFPELPEPYCRRSFHVQEMVDVGYTLRRHVLILERELYLSPSDGQIKKINPLLPFDAYMKDNPCVLMGTLPNGMRHAVAYLDGKYYDPSILTITTDYEINLELCCPVLF